MSRVVERNAARFGAASPDAHEPDDVETAFGDGIPGGVGDVVELNHAAEIGGDAFEPAPGINFVEMRVGFDAEGGGRAACCDGHGKSVMGGRSECQWNVGAAFVGGDVAHWKRKKSRRLTRRTLRKRGGTEI
jgi:hypothetical protein